MKLLNHPWVYKPAIIAATALSLVACTTTQTLVDANGNVSQSVQTAAAGAGAGCVIVAGLTYLMDPATGTMTLVQNCALGALVGAAAGYSYATFFGGGTGTPVQQVTVNNVPTVPASAYQQPQQVTDYRTGNVWNYPAQQGHPCTKTDLQGQVWSSNSPNCYAG